MRSGLARNLAGLLLGLCAVVATATAVKHWRSVAVPAVRHDYFPPPGLSADHRFRIVAFGSSSTHGRGASSPAATYPSQLKQLLDSAKLAPEGVDVVNRGIDGECIAGMLGRIDDDILARRPDLVLWQLGSNDALHGAKPGEFGPALRAGIEALRATGVPLVLIGPQWNPEPGRAALFRQFNDIMLEASRDAGLTMVNRFDLMQRWLRLGQIDAEALVGADGLHMTDKGYALLAHAVFETIVTRISNLGSRRSAMAKD